MAARLPHAEGSAPESKSNPARNEARKISIEDRSEIKHGNTSSAITTQEIAQLVAKNSMLLFSVWVWGRVFSFVNF